MQLLSGLGISLLIIALYAGTISWIFASSARLTRLAPLARNALWLGGSVTMPFTFIALVDGSRPVKYAL